jgi:diguanylate cyclase (GGDEF)-like protein/PAS domain S-box-containing protein
MRYGLLFSAILYLLLCLPTLSTAGDFIGIGVLAKRGAEKTLDKWSATADYLNEQIPEYQFQIIPLRFNEIDTAVAAGDVDFILVNPGIYVSLEHHYGVSRIATLKNRVGTNSLDQFGGVIFSRADFKGAESLQSLRGLRMMAVDKSSLGGFQMAWREMRDAGIDPFENLASLQFAGTHDAVVHAVLKGKTDVGTVRTDTLERMADEGRIDLADIKVIPHQVNDRDFPYLHSTRLYPEWPMAKLSKTPVELAERVARALLDMPSTGRAAIKSNSLGWTIPLNYQAVHELFRVLKLPPYQPHPIGLQALLKQQLPIVVLVLGGLIITLLFALYTQRINQRLKQTTFLLKKATDDLEHKVIERTHELMDKEHELETLIENLPSMIFVKDASELRFVRLNHAGELLLGKSRDELMGRNDYDFFPKEQADFFTAKDRDVLEFGHVENIEQEPIETINGTKYLHTRKVCIYDSDGQPKYLLGISNDVTEHKALLEKLDHLATRDPLTCLFNRRMLEDRLAEEMHRVNRYRYGLSLFMLDIDHFKKINDSYGHQAGDQVLRVFSRTIEESIRKTDFAARYGGEEFTVVLPMTPLSQAEELAERLRITVEQLSIPMDNDSPLRITVSIGVASDTDQQKSWERLLDDADRALYTAKQDGRNRVRCA